MRLALLFFACTIPWAAEAQFFTFHRELSAGSAGDDVAALQKYVGACGWFPLGQVTEYYGPMTVQALADFQRSKGLPATGVLDEDTRAFLNGAGLDRTLHRCLRGYDVALLQIFLAARGYFTYPEITGYFGPITEAALLAYQQDVGMEVTGLVEEDDGMIARALDLSHRGDAQAETLLLPQAPESTERPGPRRSGGGSSEPATTTPPAATTTPPVATTTPWTPVALEGKVTAWWRAADLSDGPVGSWASFVGTTTLTQATSTWQPIRGANAFNDAYPAVVADGIDDALVTTNLSALPTGSVPGEIWAVLDQQGGNILVQYGSTAQGTNRSLSRNATVNRVRVCDARTCLTDTSTLFTGEHIVGGAWSGTSETGRIDGRPFVPASTSTVPLATGTARLRFFSNNGTLPGMYGAYALAELLITLELTEDERQRVEGYWAHTYGLTGLLPDGHPYQDEAPVI